MSGGLINYDKIIKSIKTVLARLKFMKPSLAESFFVIIVLIIIGYKILETEKQKNIFNTLHGDKHGFPMTPQERLPLRSNDQDWPGSQNYDPN